MSTNSHYAPSPESSYTPPVPIIVTVIFVFLFFFGFVLVFFFRCLAKNIIALWNQWRNPSAALVGTAGANMSSGLDPELIRAFPTFCYSSVKEFCRAKYGLECAICLGDFDEEDMLRLLTICCHVFHKECVDLWLESHKTCPVCRGDLDVPGKSMEKSPLLVRSHSMHEIGANESSLLQDSVCIEIKEDNNEEEKAEAEASSHTGEQQNHEKREKMERFSRSHSTGHSTVRTTEEDDRYTLRLREHVRIKIVKGHNSAGSCIAFGDFTSPSVYRNGTSAEASENTRRRDVDNV